MVLAFSLLYAYTSMPMAHKNYEFDRKVMLAHIEGLCAKCKHLLLRDKYIMSAEGDIHEISRKNLSGTTSNVK